MKDTIIQRLSYHGWLKDRIVDAFSKTFQTCVAPKRASIWLRFDKEGGRWWLADGDFTSAGENVLATSFAILPVGMLLNAIELTVDALVTKMELKIASAYSVRLLNKPSAQEETVSCT